MSQTPAITPPAAPLGATAAAESGMTHAAKQTVKFFVNGANPPPSLHRVGNAVGISLGLLAGRMFMDVLVGQTVDGKDVKKEDVVLPMRPFHGLLAYNHFSDDPKDRWMKVVDRFVPAILGGVGGYWGSELYFRMNKPFGIARQNPINEAMKDPAKITMEAADDMIMSHQARKPWRVMNGATSVFGSSAGVGIVPGPWNFGTNLSMALMPRPRRNKIILPFFGSFMTGTKHLDVNHSVPGILTDIVGVGTHNAEHAEKQVREYSKAVLESLFDKRFTPEHAKTFADTILQKRDEYLAKGPLTDGLKKELEKDLTGLIRGIGLEKTLLKVGLNPLHADLGESGAFSTFARMFGAGKNVHKTQKAYWESFVLRNPEFKEMLPEAEKEWVARNKERQSKLGKQLLVAGGVTAGLFGGLIALNRPSEPEKTTEYSANSVLENGHTPVVGPHTPVRHQQGNSWTNVLHGKPLDFFEWMTDGFNSQETFGAHRVTCALGLTLAGLGGMKLSEALTGHSLAGAAVAKEQVWDIFRPLYKKMVYNPHTDFAKDHFKRGIAYLIPAMTGAYGVVTASDRFFAKRTKRLSAAEYVDDYIDKASMEQAKPWTMMTAVTSLMGSASGFPWMPFPVNYGTALNTRYMMMNGREVILPGLGEFWTNNHSRFPEGPVKLLARMTKYAANNPARDPELLGEMAYGFLGKVFGKVTDQQVQEFINKLHEVRDQYWVEGTGVPPEKRAECLKELDKVFKHEGLEKTLMSIGLDPAQAKLANNGMAGTIANVLGAGSAVKAVEQEFRDKITKRKPLLEQAVKSVLEEKAPSVNDEAPSYAKKEMSGGYLSRLNREATQEHSSQLAH